MDHTIPYRRHTNGSRPGITGVTDPMALLRWKWPKPPQKFTEEEKRQILGKLVENAVKMTFNSHFYKWGGKIYQQMKGGPIGLKASGSVAKIAMEIWLREYRKRLEKAGFKVWLLQKYVDDVVIVCSMAKRGHRLVNGILERDCDTFSEDSRNLRRVEDITLDILQQIANQIFPFLKFTGETSYGELSIPVLDTELWFGEKRFSGPIFQTGEGYCAPGRTQEPGEHVMGLLYKFYKKPMASRIGILRRSCMMEGTKVSTVCAELKRRWKNTSEWCSREDFEKVTKLYLDDLEGMGYSQEWQQKVLTSAIKGYCKILYKVQSGLCRRNRSGASSWLTRRHKRLVGQATWFKSKERENEKGEKQSGRTEWKRTPMNREEFTTVMFIPHTKEGKLKRKLQEMEDNLRFPDRVRYVEKTGASISNVLVKRDPWESECLRPGCLTCTHSPGICGKKGVVYKFSCITCKEGGKEAIYHGESSRTLWERMQEHKKKLEKMDDDSPLVEHLIEVHGEGAVPNFKLELVKAFRKPLERQVYEGVKITLSNPDITMNRKGEWGQNLPPKFSCDEFKEPKVAQKKKSLQVKRKKSEGLDQNPNANEAEAKANDADANWVDDQNPNANEAEAKANDADANWVDDLVDDVDVVDRVDVPMKEKSEVPEGVTDSGAVHIEKRIKLDHQLGVEDLTHSRVESCQKPDSQASVDQIQFISTSYYQENKCIMQRDKAKPGLLLNMIKANDQDFEINPRGLRVRQGKLIFSRDYSKNSINTTQRNNQTVQFESQNQHSAGSPEEAQSDCISLPHLGETS